VVNGVVVWEAHVNNGVAFWEKGRLNVTKGSGRFLERPCFGPAFDGLTFRGEADSKKPIKRT